MQVDDLVSIIVPVYNAASYIEQTMKMVVKQDYSNWELLLVDDCSTDGSVEVIKKAISRETLKNPELEGKFVLLEGTVNEGAACARNRGIELLSENQSARLSTSVAVLLTFPLPPAGQQAKGFSSF